MFSVDLTGKKGLIMGVTNHRSIAWSIAKPLAEAGAQLAFSYQGDRLKPTLEKLTADLDSPVLAECDVTSDSDLDQLFATLEQTWGRLDFVVHAVAFAPTETFARPFREVKRDDWHTAMDVSAYSLVAVTQRAAKLMTDGGSIVTLSYLAAEKVVPHYNMMGVAKAALEASVRYLAYDLGPQEVRVNAISAGPVRTVAARSIAGFGDMYSEAGRLSMMNRNITADEVGQMAFALLSPMGGGVTGETLYVDAGFNAIGMFLEERQGEDEGDTSA